MKIQEERKASTNLLALQEHIPTTWEHGPKNRSENRSSAVQSKPDRKKAPASKASEQRSGKNSPEETAAERIEERQTSKQILKKYFVSIHKRTSETTHKTHGHPHPATPPPPRRQTATPPPQRPPPQKKHQPTNAKFWHEFWNNAMELREHGNAVCNGYENEVRSRIASETLKMTKITVDSQANFTTF